MGTAIEPGTKPLENAPPAGTPPESPSTPPTPPIVPQTPPPTDRSQLVAIMEATLRENNQRIQELVAENVNWVLGNPPDDTFRAQVKIRYKAVEAWSQVTLLDGGDVRIRFDDSQRDITPGQAAVIYQGDICLGGGIITGAAN